MLRNMEASGLYHPLRAWTLTMLVFMCLPALAAAQTATLTRIDARPEGHRLDSRVESDPILGDKLLASFGAFGRNKNGPSVIRVPAWLPDSEKTHPDAVYYMYYADHGGRDIRLAWSASITGEWHLFNRGNEPDRAWGVDGDYSGAQTPGNGVLDLNAVGTDDVVPVREHFGLRSHIASPDVHVDDVNRRIVMYFHGPVGPKGSGLPGTATFVATSKYGLNFNMPHEGGEKGHGVRNVLIAGQYLKTFEVEGEENGKKVNKTFGLVNGAGLWVAPTFTSAGEAASHANADEKGGFWNPSWVGNPTPRADRKRPYWWTVYKEDTEANPYHGTVKAPELVPPENLHIVRKHNQGPRHFAIYHSPRRDRNKIYVFYTARRDLPESIVYTTFDLTGLSETERLDPALWKRTGHVERVLLKPEMVWEGAERPYVPSLSGGANEGHQLRDPDVFEDVDGKLYMFYCGDAEGAIGVAELTFAEEPKEKSLRVTSPSEGYACLIGIERNIGWISTGNIHRVELEYTVNGTDWIQIARGVQNKHYYRWTIPDTPSKAAWIRVRETGGTIVAKNGPFRIEPIAGRISEVRLRRYERERQQRARKP